MADFLEGLPSHNKNNFSHYQTNSYQFHAKKFMYLPTSTKDHPKEQTITSGRTATLLRFLQKHYDFTHLQNKRDLPGPSGTQDQAPRKKTREN